MAIHSQAGGRARLRHPADAGRPAAALAVPVTGRGRHRHRPAGWTFVLAAPLRPPRLAAWEAHSMSVLTEGRFELGIGTGRPAVRQFAQQLGLHYGSATERLAQLDQTIDHLRELDPPAHTPVLIAAGGPRARALAAAKADIITLAAGPLSTRDEVAQMVTQVLEQAGIAPRKLSWR